MLSSTLAEGLRDYEIGDKVRALRLRKKMALVELGKHTGLSAALLSKIERSNIYPPLPTLLRIAMVFGVGLDHFFGGPSNRPVLSIVRKKDRVRLPNSPEGKAAYFFESLDFKATERKLNSYYAEFQPVSEKDAPVHAHEGVELIFLVSGELLLTIGREQHDLGEGDSIYFESSIPHSYRRKGKLKCAAIVVTTA